MNATYRCKWHFGWMGLLCTAMAIAFVGGLCFALMEDRPDATPWKNLVLILILMGPILLLGLGGPWMIAFAIRHRLSFDGQSIESVGIFRTKRIELARVAEARWRIGQDGGRLRLRSESDKLQVEFSLYPPDEARELIKLFRSGLPASVQTGWDKYWDFTWRMFDKPDPAQREQFAAETRALRIRLAIWLLLGAMVLFAAGVVVWRYTGRPGALISTVVVLLLWLYVRRVRADRGKIAGKTNAIPGVSPLLVAGMLVLMLTMGVCSLVLALDIGGRQTLFYSGATLGTVLIAVGAALTARKIERGRRDGAKLAEQEYMPPPADGRDRFGRRSDPRQDRLNDLP